MTSSVVVPGEATSNKSKKEEEREEQAANSAASIRTDPVHRPRVPPLLQSTLRLNMANSGSNASKNYSKLGGMMRNSIRNVANKMKDRTTCEIC